jgi:hypothetical protein
LGKPEDCEKKGVMKALLYSCVIGALGSSELSLPSPINKALAVSEDDIKGRNMCKTDMF